MRISSTPLLLALTFALSGPALAARLGDPAAPLSIEEWVKGEAVDVKDGKNVYVVEFWATWCGPCLTSIPHLTELQKKFKSQGVVFVGVSDETSAKVKPFVSGQGGKMDYRVAVDDSRKTTEAYMKAYGQNGIPTAFIVGKDGKVLWVGHPMAELEETLQQVIDGKYDLAAAARQDEFRASLREYQALAAKGDEKAKELGAKLLATAGDNVASLSELAFDIVAMDVPNRDFALADRALDQAEKTGGKEDARIVSVRAITRFESGQEAQGLELARQAVELAKTPNEKARYQNYVSVMERRMKPAIEAK